MERRSPTYEELVALVRELRDRVAVLERENADLRRRLEEKRPPPSLPPFVKPSVPPRRKGKKPGRPAGHPPAHRPPPPEVHQEVAVPLPEDGDGECRCPHCRGGLADLKDHERVVEDIVPAAVRVTHLAPARVVGAGEPRSGRGGATVREQVGRFRELAEAGAQTAIIGLSDDEGAASVRRFADVVTAFQDG